VPLNRGDSRQQTGLRIGAGTAGGGTITEGESGAVPEVVPFSTKAEGPFTGPIIRLGG